MNSYPLNVMQSFLSLTHYIFNIWLGTDAMASKDTQRRLIKDNKQRPRDPNVLDVRRTVSTRSVAAKFEVTAYSKLAPPKILNLCIFEYTYVYLNIHGHFVDDYRIWTPFDSRPVNSKLWVSANP